jgi:deoxyhypusine monooxygenase
MLCRHEIAFVFGQLLSIHSVPALLQVLRDEEQSDMVRHEAAEALGGIGAPDLKPILEEWAKRQDAPRVVRESCEVALDMWEVSIARPRQVTTRLMTAYHSTRTRVHSSTPTVSKMPARPL